jgi:hypothetical protein
LGGQGLPALAPDLPEGEQEVEFQEDSALADRLLSDLAKELDEEKPLSHLTELVYCLTRSYLQRIDPSPPTPDEILLFMSGIGLERVLLKGHRQHIRGECEGIHYDTDFLDYDGRVAEFKTTRMSSKKPPEEFSEGWKRQILGYLYAHILEYANRIMQDGKITREPIENPDLIFRPTLKGVPADHIDLVSGSLLEATLAVLHLGFPLALKAWRIKATWEEIAGNWKFLQGRKVTYLDHYKRGVMPRQFTYNMDWECGYCRYKFLCDARQAAEELEEDKQ